MNLINSNVHGYTDNKNLLNGFNEKDLKNFYTVKHKSGLTILMYLMPKYNSAYAMIGTKYGSVNSSFKLKAEDDFIHVPDGTAHFLEHKLFDNPDGVDTFTQYSQIGTGANAYTTFDRTCYLFLTCSEKFKESLEILLKSVTTPYFTKETVVKEQGIIGQEIKMYEDNPSWSSFFSLLKCLYHNNSIKIDLSGTVESIAKITPEILYKCYDIFYNLNNMVLSIAGNFSIEDVTEIADKILCTKSEPIDIINEEVHEPTEVLSKKCIKKLPVAMPVMSMGFKHIPKMNCKENFILSIKYDIINNIIAGATSDLYRELYDKKFISKPVSTEIVFGENYLSSIFVVETRYVDEVQDSLKHAIANIQKHGIDIHDIESMKKRLYGQHIVELDNIKDIATNNMEGCFNRVDFRTWNKIIDNITKEEIDDIVMNSFKEEAFAVSIVLPE